MTSRRWRIAALAGSGVALVALAVVLFWPAGPGDLQCRRVELQDTVTGLLVGGIEDVALDPVAPRLILSAYDRRTDEPGGLYGVGIDVLRTPSGRLVQAPRLAPAPGGPPLRPHGFAVAPAGPDGKAARLAAIIRIRQGDGGHAAQLRFFSLSAAGLAPAGVTLDAPSLCNANDVEALDQGAAWLVTSDRKACSPVGRLLEDMLGGRNGSVRLVRERTLNTVASDIAFANGIALAGGTVFVAATRAKAILLYDRDALLASRQALTGRWPLKGAPDNLATGSDGAIYIAAHEDLLRYALYRAGLRSSARSYIYRFDPQSGAAPDRIGLAGGKGSLQGATVALRVGDDLVLGAAYDHGLAVCRYPQKGTP